jgi:1,2-phenylacetyl-CoA epoxidase PaaB subunit
MYTRRTQGTVKRRGFIMHYSQDRDAIEQYVESIMRRETRRCLWVLSAFVASFTFTLSVLVR